MAFAEDRVKFSASAITGQLSKYGSGCAPKACAWVAATSQNRVGRDMAIEGGGGTVQIHVIHSVMGGKGGEWEWGRQGNHEIKMGLTTDLLENRKQRRGVHMTTIMNRDSNCAVDLLLWCYRCGSVIFYTVFLRSPPFGSKRALGAEIGVVR